MPVLVLLINDKEGSVLRDQPTSLELLRLLDVINRSRRIRRAGQQVAALRQINLERVDGAFVGGDDVLVVGEVEGSDAAGFDPAGEGTWAESARFSLLDLPPHSSSIFFVLSLSLSLFSKAPNEFRT